MALNMIAVVFDGHLYFAFIGLGAAYRFGAAAALVARGRALEEVRRDLHRFTTRGLYGIEAPTE